MRPPISTFLTLLLLVGPTVARSVADDLTPAQSRFFETKIRPVLVKNCYGCHSAKSGKAKGGLLLDTRMGIRKGGESGHGVVPGDVKNSLVIDAIEYGSFEMPPKKQLPDSVIRNFKEWVRMGAPDPRGGKSIVKNKAKIDFENGRKFWAFIRPKKVEPPRVKNESLVKDDIDRFVLARLEKQGLKPVEPASEENLLRRDYINLIGLPPTEKQVAEYLADPAKDKREKLIDRLLQSPRFGERWGRHWLDVARFAESNGRERNFLFPHAWRFRNYVIDSFNNDKPFDRFITEQIAGDLIKPRAGQNEHEPKIGTGFLAIGPKLLNERNREVFSMDLVDDQIDVVCRSTMAVTVSCARCHDHKFDPISTEDYYALAGIFRSTKTLFGKGGGGSRQATPLMDVSDKSENPNPVATAHTAKVAKLNQQVKTLNQQIRAKQKLVGKGGKKSKRGPIQKELAQLRKRLKTAQQQLNRLKQSAPEGGELAMGVEEGTCVDCNVLIRGEVTGRGPVVPRGFLTVLSANSRQRVKSTDSSGRLELAQWIVSPNNPLTARVTVNRIWRHLFGQGIVRTVDNFGESGERPTHPELLDHLALRLIENKWSFKQTIRQIMLSQTYQLSNEYSKSNYEIDPDNRMLWRMNSRRLDAEVIRDSLLQAAGRLRLERPESSVVAKYKSTQGIGRGVTEETFEVEFPHRSVFLPVVRNAIPEPLRVFDFAEPSMLVGDRQVTNVPTQALFMMNSEFVLKNTRALAERLNQPGSDMNSQIQRAYQVVLSRNPTTRELDRGAKFVRTASNNLSKKSKTDGATQAMAAFCQALFSSSEFRLLP